MPYLLQLILTIAATFFLAIVFSFVTYRAAAVSQRSELRHPTEVHFDEGLAPENVDEHLEFEVIGIDLGDFARKICEWVFLDANCFSTSYSVFAGRAAVSAPSQFWSEERTNLTSTEGAGCCPRSLVRRNR